MSVSGGMHGKGQTTGINYTARGNTDDSLRNWVPYNADTLAKAKEAKQSLDKLMKK